MPTFLAMLAAAELSIHISTYHISLKITLTYPGMQREDLCQEIVDGQLLSVLPYSPRSLVTCEVKI